MNWIGKGHENMVFALDIHSDKLKRYKCYNFGGSDQVKRLELIAYAWINLAIFQEQGWKMALKMLQK